MKIVFVMLAMLLLVGAASAEVDWSRYDANNDRMIDGDERVALDIDIEAGRLTFEESAWIDGYTVDGTILLTEEFQAVALSQGSGAVSEPVEELASTSTDVEPAAVVIAPPAEPVVAQAAEPAEDVAEPMDEVEPIADTPASASGVAIVAVFVVVAGVLAFVIWWITRNNDE